MDWLPTVGKVQVFHRSAQDQPQYIAGAEHLFLRRN